MIAVNNNKKMGGNEAAAFGSMAVSLLDDESAVMVLPVDYGHVLIAESSSATHGMAWVRGSSSVKYAGGANFDVVTNTVLEGTTGIDGKITISTNNNNFYVENRSGAPVSLSITFLGMAANRI
ncbi:hypothetical protein [Aeromonas dhakensis]|uniref:hypothetical protein n=1 Tax=Aeromonas dhakensis TaxID=196024 RepID=UPI002B47EBA2|nr:hypothetical protein [Aeromonas dhakensis]